MKTFPSKPLMEKSGRNTSTTIKDAKMIEFLISLEASNTTCNVGRGFFLCLFSRKRLNTFSTSTIASSTSSPIATASPPSVIVLMLIPNHLKIINVTTKERGIATSVIAVVLKLSKNKKRIIATRMDPSRSASVML